MAVLEVAFVLLLVMDKMCGVPLSDFYSFGTAAVDVALATGDNSLSTPLEFQEGFVYFGNKSYTITVSMPGSVAKLAIMGATIHLMHARSTPMEYCCSALALWPSIYHSPCLSADLK